MGYTLREFWGQFHGFKIERIGSVRVRFNIDHVEMTFLPTIRGGLSFGMAGAESLGMRICDADSEEGLGLSF